MTIASSFELESFNPLVSFDSNNPNPSTSDGFLEGLKQKLHELSLQSDAYSQLDSIFSIENSETVHTYLSEWNNGIFRDLPSVVVLNDASMHGSAGAYSADIQTIYLAESTVLHDGLTGLVIAEEYGHHLDQVFNSTGDSQGDEGELFSHTLIGIGISNEELSRIASENDKGFININGQLLSVEYSQIAIESHDGRLYQSKRGEQNQIYTRSSKDGIGWTAWHQSDGSTYDDPALASVGDRLYQSVRGTDNRIYTRHSTNGENWSGWHQTEGATLSAPALAALNGKLYQSVRGTDNNIYTRSSYNGRDWSDWHQTNGQTKDAPTLTALNGKLYQSVRGTDNNIYTRSSFNGQSWTQWSSYDYGKTEEAVSLTAFNGRLYQSHRGQNNKIYSRSSYNGTTWSGWTQEDDYYTTKARARILGSNQTSDVTFERVQGPDYIEDKETWLVIHGWDSNARNFRDLAGAIEEYDGHWGGGDAQVITVDWNGSNTGKLGWGLHRAASWIDSVAEVIKDAVEFWGIDKDKINIVGHSLGAYVAYETSERLGGINKLVALNPASFTDGGYDTNQVNFSRHSNYSWAFFHNHTFDSASRSLTADESFKIEFTTNDWDINKGHGSGKEIFKNMLKNKYGSVSQYFGLDDMRAGRYTPWKIDSGWEALIEVNSGFTPTGRWYNA